jgi:ribosome maturation factor RimP
MKKFAYSIFGLRSFGICTFIMVTLLKRSATSGGNYYCKALVLVDNSIARSVHKNYEQTLQIHSHFSQQKPMNQWRNHNIRKNAHLDCSSLSAIRRHVTTLPMSPTGITTSAMTSEKNNSSSEQQKNEINQRIYNVAKTMCNLSPNQITITWKSKRIVVTVHTENAFIDTSTSDGDDIDENEIEIDLIKEEDFMDDNDDDVGEENSVDSTTGVDEVDDRDPTIDPPTNESINTVVMSTAKNYVPENDTAESAESTTDSVDLTLLARSINVALDDGEDGIGTRITEQYEIEVSTPGIISDEITTPRMFAAYRGFDVIVHYFDPKKKVMKQHEGRLVEKNEEYVIINQKGRMKHFKNIHVQAVKLPKFKSEKGLR